MENKILPIRPFVALTRPQPPVSLPPIPRIPPHKRGARERKAAVPILPVLQAAKPVALLQGGATVSFSRPALLLRLLSRSLQGGAIQSLAVKLAPAVFAASAVLLPYQWIQLNADSSGGAYSAVVVPSETDSGRTGLPASYAAKSPADPRSLVIPEDLPAQAAGAQEAPSPIEPAAPEPLAGVAVQSAEKSITPPADESLKDALRMAQPRSARAERLSWGGIQSQRVGPQGGEFREMKAPKLSTVSGRDLAGSLPTAAGRRGALSGSARRILGGSRVQPGLAQRAMGQLKLAKTLSVDGATSSTYDAARQGATDAFEQSKSIGGAGLSADATPSTGLGASAPDVTEAAPALPPGVNKTPYQDKVDGAKKKNNMTKVMLILGAVLLAVGAVLLIVAHHLMETKPDLAAILEKIGYGLLGAGAAMILAGILMAQQAKEDGKKIGDQYGQKDQQAVVEDCTDQSLGKRDCAPKSVEQPLTTVHEAAGAESKAGYSLEGAR